MFYFSSVMLMFVSSLRFWIDPCRPLKISSISLSSTIRFRAAGITGPPYEAASPFRLHRHPLGHPLFLVTDIVGYGIGK